MSEFFKCLWSKVSEALHLRAGRNASQGTREMRNALDSSTHSMVKCSELGRVETE